MKLTPKTESPDRDLHSGSGPGSNSPQKTQKIPPADVRSKMSVGRPIFCTLYPPIPHQKHSQKLDLEL